MTGYELPEVPCPENYLPIHMAGEGTNGYAYFCIPKRSITSPTNQSDLKKLRSKICVVKVATSRRFRKRDAVKREVDSLLAVQTQGGSLSKRVVQIVDIGGINELAGPWYAMAPIYGKSLDAFMRPYLIEDKSVPQAFVWHVFFQLFEGLAYLHSPRMVHGDLCSGSVMLDSAHQDYPGFPNVVLIDFGSYEAPTGNEEELKEAVASDAWQAYDIVHRLTWRGYQEPKLDPENDLDWANFINGLKDMKRASGNLARRLQGWDTREFLKRFGDIAANRRKGTTPEILQEIQEALNLKEIHKTLDQKLRAAVEWHSLEQVVEP
ncbi:uncharacterized protein BDZ99DRAFT_539640 [Mytilinidion resinicola]|uniref:Protein kinase domain-containing protein n=1 Tax=Mytilinidion resinicola TaxID=574789 RepID=A0A6A6YE52_9PEZI|nr:uncharacterized protein BDZ99DRAFT_539640 [Mytilinidion resinicola]KAF2806127.1 hypothetical protein BDZ99DRAFT_539640 [Mytilinidion resinicola]